MELVPANNNEDHTESVLQNPLLSSAGWSNKTMNFNWQHWVQNDNKDIMLIIITTHSTTHSLRQTALTDIPLEAGILLRC